MANQPTKYRKFVVGAASAALVASAVAPVVSAADLSDVKGNTHEEGINALIALGAISGYPDGTFQPNKTLTRSDVVKMMGKYLETLGQKVPADYKTVQRFDDLPVTANEELVKYAALVHDAGVFKGNNGKLDAAGNITRENMALVLVRAFDAILDRDLVAEVAATDFKKEVTDLSAAKTEAHGAINVLDFLDITTVATFNPKGSTTRGHFATFLNNTIKAEAEGKLPAKITTTATKVETVSATNLKEITVTFDGTVDKASAQDVDKYSVDSSVELEAATLLEDGKTVRLTVKPFSNGLVLQNQKAYKLSVKNVKAGEKFVDASNVAFTPVDNTLPEVSEVKSLGTKAIKVTFSEPVKTATSANFKLDGKSFFGSVSEGSRSVILKPYSSTDLTVGDHKLEVTGVEDFAGFKSLTKEFAFTVVEDLVAPTVKSVSATLEKVTITFSEEVDPETVVKSNIYWKSGADKKAAGSVTEIAPDVYEFDFSANSLPGYEVTLFVEGVKDYSGNQITETEVKVRAEVDQTRPEVSEASISKTDSKNITLKFNKTVKIEDIKYFTLTDSDGDAVAIRTVTAANGTFEDKVFTIQTYDELDDTYTLKIIGVRDTTKLQNTMNDYSVTLNGKDTTAPSYVSNSANSGTRTIIVNFDEKMELASLADKKNYLVTINNKSQQLPEGTEVTPVQDGNAVRIVFPEYINNDTVGINDPAKGANVTAFKLLALKDVAGNIIADFGGADIPANTALATVKAYDANTAEHAKLTAKGVVKVRFDQPIGKAVASDFEVLTGTGVSISSVTADGSDVVTVTLSGNLNNTALVDTVGPTAITLAVKAGNKILTTSGNSVVQTQKAFNVKDTVKPQVQLATGQSRLAIKAGTNNTILVPFSEALKDATSNAGANASLVANYKHDLVVTNVRTGAILPVDKYDTTVLATAPSVLEIQLDGSVATSDEYKVSVKANASFIQDLAGNKTVSSSTYLTEVGAIRTTTATVTNVTSSAANGTYKVDDVISVTVTFSEAVNVTGVPELALNSGTSATYASGSGTSNLVFTYTVAAGDTSAKLDVTGTTALTLAGGTINGIALTPKAASLTLAAPGTTGSLGANKAIVIDGVAVAATTTVGTQDSVAASATTTVTFSEELDAASKTAVETAIKGAVGGVTGADLGFAWAGAVLTVTNNGAVAATFAADATVSNVKDLAGNVTATVSIDLKS